MYIPLLDLSHQALEAQVACPHDLRKLLNRTPLRLRALQYRSQVLDRGRQMHAGVRKPSKTGLAVC